MTWRFAVAPNISVGISVAVLSSCLFTAPRRLAARLHPGVPLSPQSCRRGLCWVRRTTPFSRRDATAVALLQGSADKQLVSLIDSDSVREDATNAKRPILVDINLGPSSSSSDLGSETHGASDSAGYPLQRYDTRADSKPRRADSLKVRKFRRILNASHAALTDGRDKQYQWFPYLDQFKVKGKILTSAQIIDMLGPFMLEERKERIRRVVANRTYAVCPVVEGLLDLGNIAAVLRSADALGFQSVHVISNETEKRYKKNRKISLGSEKWLDAELYLDPRDCFEELRSRGYRIAVASLSEKTVPIQDIDWTIPTAVVFGNEYKGISMEALQSADISCFIPMEGMVDSFNVSVAAGIVLHHAATDRKSRLGKQGDLGEVEQQILSADFYLRHSSRSLSVIEHMLQLKQETKKGSAVCIKC